VLGEHMRDVVVRDRVGNAGRLSREGLRIDPRGSAVRINGRGRR